MSCGTTRRGGELGIKPITTIYGIVYDGIIDDDICVDILYPTFVRIRVNLSEETVDCSSGRCCVTARVFPSASRCFPFFFVHISCWSRDQDGS